MPWVWSACSMGIQHRVEPIDVGVEQLLAQVGRGVDQDPASCRRAVAALDQQRAAAAAVLRVVRIAGAPAERRPRHAAGGAAAENCKASASCRSRLRVRAAPLQNSRKKFSVVWRAISSERDAARFRQHFCGLDHIGRLVALAAKLAGRKIRRVGFDQDAVGRQVGRDGAQVLATS